jgi:hypothetical protein
MVAAGAEITGKPVAKPGKCSEWGPLLPSSLQSEGYMNTLDGSQRISIPSGLTIYSKEPQIPILHMEQRWTSSKIMEESKFSPQYNPSTQTLCSIKQKK